MKTKVILGGLVLVGLVSHQTLAQEYDDMYFNSKDRAKMKTSQTEVNVNDKIDADYNNFKKRHFNQEEELVIPTDSYSSRNVNPEYVARQNSELASEDNADYFVEGYNPYTKPVNQNYNPYYANSYYGNNWGAPWYGYNTFGSYYNPYYNPYSYGSPYGYYDGWGSPYYGSYYPGSTFSFYYGSNWGYGWNYGYSNYWGNGFYNPYCSYYSPYYNNNYTYYPSRNETRYVTYGKYGSRNGSLAGYNPDASSSNRVNTGRIRETGGRVSGTETNGRITTSTSSSDRQAEYYNPRRRASTLFGQSPTNNTFNSNSQNSGSRSNSTFFNNSTNSNNRSNNNTFNNSNSGSRSNGGSTFTPSRSSSSSSGSSGSSGGSGGRSGGGRRGGN